MRRIRVRWKMRRPRGDRNTVLALDPRDPDVVRVKGTSANLSPPHRHRVG